MIADLFTCERHLVYNMPDCHHIYIFLFLNRFRKVLEVVNFFLKLKGSNYEILLCNNFFLKEFVYLGLF